MALIYTNFSSVGFIRKASWLMGTDVKLLIKCCQ